jgi:hypothetical protein
LSSMNISTLAYEKPVELLHDADDVIVQVHQALYDSLRFPPAKIAKRYLGDDLAIALELTFEINGRASRYAALVIHVPLPEVNVNLRGPGRGNDDQFSMLVDNVEVVDSQEHRIRRVGATIWLKSLDEFANSSVCDPLYFSFILGEHVSQSWRFFENRKLNKPNILPPVIDTREMPDDVIEARSKMVNDLAGENTEAKRNRTLAMILDRLRNDLLVLVAEEGYSLSSKNPAISASRLRMFSLDRFSFAAIPANGCDAGSTILFMSVKQNMPEMQRFDNALRGVLSVSKADLNQMLAEEKKAKRWQARARPET